MRQQELVRAEGAVALSTLKGSITVMRSRVVLLQLRIRRETLVAYHAFLRSDFLCRRIEAVHSTFVVMQIGLRLEAQAAHMTLGVRENPANSFAFVNLQRSKRLKAAQALRTIKATGFGAGWRAAVVVLAEKDIDRGRIHAWPGGILL